MEPVWDQIETWDLEDHIGAFSFDTSGTNNSDVKRTCRFLTNGFLAEKNIC